MAKVLVTGGCGYIGSHTVVDLIEHGYEVVIADNLSRSTRQRMDGIKAITGKDVALYEIDLCDATLVKQMFNDNPDIEGIIHFAAYMSVPESVEQPLLYFRNNLNSLINVLDEAVQHQVAWLVFSSSCSVYGNAKDLPVTEQTAFGVAESPYARTKQIGEQMIGDTVRAYPTLKAVILRYFNPVGAHPSAQLGELPSFKPNSLGPIITRTAIGKRDKLTVYGTDYNTPDGTCVRDYIHVSDIAYAHTLALKHLQHDKATENPEVFNLGTGNGVTVLEIIHAFEAATGVKLNYELGPRRDGDVESIYANNEKATHVLGWRPQYNLKDMMAHAWAWEVHLNQL